MTTDKRYSLVGSSMGGGAAKASEGVNTHAVISAPRAGRERRERRPDLRYLCRKELGWLLGTA